MSAWKTVLNFGLSYISGFYTAFVLMMLWDWFAAPAFHVGEIRYWNMYGLLLLVRLVGPSINLVVIEKWESAMKMIEACIPEERRLETMAAIKKDSLSDNVQLLIANFMAILGSTIALGIGWVVHALLV